MIKALQRKTPQIGKNTFVAESADVIGDVVIGDHSSIWFRCVLRGDVFPIRVGSHTNIQDGSILHGTSGKCGATLGDRVTIGHGVILHGCTVGNETLIGMGSLLLDESFIPGNCFVGAGSLVTEQSRFEPGWLILGRPAKAIRRLREDELEFLKASAKNYVNYMSWYKGD